MRKIILAVCCLCITHTGFAADARPNPRGGGTATQTQSSGLTTRNSKEADVKEQVVENSRRNRAAANRSAVERGALPRAAQQQRHTGVTVSRSAAMPIVGAKATAKSSTAARSAVRAATVNAIAKGSALPASRGRSAIPQGTARATAIFTNTGSMGAEYNQCRESYFACMDQFCGLKSDTYRRCLCSDRFRSFKEKEDAFEQAKQMILQFKDRNLSVIGLDAAAVSDMQSATAGEAALGTDTSAASQMLANINDLLSGKAKATTSAPVSTSTSTSASSLTLNLDFSASDDIWGASSSTTNDPFANNRSNPVDIESMEGKDLYNEVHKQCMDVAAVCQTNQATGNMVTSAYTVLISQDCSTYEKKLDGQKSALESTISELQNAMWDARLEDHYSRNSASVNECIAKVRQSLMDPFACGPNWERCLDFTGIYINSTTGEPIFTAQLSNLKYVINLNNPEDPANKTFLDNLDNLKNRARDALSTCENDSTAVWDAFKQQALIEIAQAQDKKIESIKDTCLTLVNECYDKQTGQTKNFGQSENAELSANVQSVTAAMGQRLARATCSEKVSACASLHAKPGDPKCEFNNNGELTNAGQCGMSTLLAFVDTVDETKITMLCKSDLENFMRELCTPVGGNQTATATGESCGTNGTGGTITSRIKGDKDCNGMLDPAEEETLRREMELSPPLQARNEYPYKCRLMPRYGRDSVYESLVQRAETACLNPDTNQFDQSAAQAIREIMLDIEEKMTTVLQHECVAAAGEGGEAFWVDSWDPDSSDESKNVMNVLPKYVNDVYGSNGAFESTISNSITINYGGAGGGAQDGHGTATVMPTPSSGALFNGNTENANLVSRENMMPKSWGSCEVATAKTQCETLNALAAGSGGGQLATYNPTTRRCDFSTDYYKTLCENYLNVPGFNKSARWDAQVQECVFMR